MRVEILKPIRTSKGGHKPGDVVDLPDADARTALVLKCARLVADSKAQPVETAEARPEAETTEARPKAKPKAKAKAKATSSSK